MFSYTEVILIVYGSLKKASTILKESTCDNGLRFPSPLTFHLSFLPLSLSLFTYSSTFSLSFHSSPLAFNSHFSAVSLTFPFHFPFSLFTPPSHSHFSSLSLSLLTLHPSTLTLPHLYSAYHSVNNPIERPTDLADTVISSCNKLICNLCFHIQR